jgi:pimeloyl-ACP methyl ester carboxylesterase
MPIATVRGIDLAYAESGSGQPVLLVAPAGTRGAVWAQHQVPALAEAGYRAVTFDYRGTPPSTVPVAPFRLPDLVQDAAELIKALGLAPCHVIGASLGAMIAQELVLARPGLVRSAALLGTRCRTGYLQGIFARAYAAHIRAAGPVTELDALSLLMRLFSPRMLADDQVASDWLALARTFPVQGIGPALQYEATIIPDRTPALHDIDRPCLVMAFSADVITPPVLCREVATAIPGSHYEEIPGCGHFGFLERPAEVNAALTAFLAGGHRQSSLTNSITP